MIRRVGEQRLDESLQLRGIAFAEAFAGSRKFCEGDRHVHLVEVSDCAPHNLSGVESIRAARFGLLSNVHHVTGYAKHSFGRPDNYFAASPQRCIRAIFSRRASGRGHQPQRSAEFVVHDGYWIGGRRLHSWSTCLELTCSLRHPMRETPTLGIARMDDWHWPFSPRRIV